MAISLRGILRTATRGVAAGLQGAEEGREISRQRRRDDEERQRRLELDALKKSLLEFDVEATARQADREALAPDLAEARLSEQAHEYATRFPDAVPQGLSPAIAVQRGQAAEKRTDEDRAHTQDLALVGAREGAGAVNAAAGRRELTNQRGFERERSLRDDYRAEVKPIEEAYTTVDAALGNIGAAKAGDPSAKVELLYAFVKAMDPNSVVREGEIALARAALPIWERAATLYREVAEGKSPLISDEMVTEMGGLLERRNRRYEERWQEIADYYGERAAAHNVSGDAFRKPPVKYRGDVLDNY